MIYNRIFFDTMYCAWIAKDNFSDYEEWVSVYCMGEEL